MMRSVRLRLSPPYFRNAAMESFIILSDEFALRETLPEEASE